MKTMHFRAPEIIFVVWRAVKAMCLVAIPVVFLLTGLGNTARAATITPVAISVCTACASQADLLAAATTYFGTWFLKTPPGYVGVISATGYPTGQVGTMLIVVGGTVPISAGFDYVYHVAHGGYYATVPIYVTTNTQTISSDALLLARSAKTGEIALPPGYTVNDTQEEISSWLSSAGGVPIGGAPSASLWHGLTNYPQLLQGTFTITATGQQFTLWNGDVITVTDSNGWSAQFQWTPLSSVQWTLVPNSIRNAQGKPPGAPNLAPTSTQEPGAAQTIALPGGQIITIIPTTVPPNQNVPRGTVILEPDPQLPAPTVSCTGNPVPCD
jgi:hypothetical protein